MAAWCSASARETVVEYPLSFDDFLFCEQVARDLGVHFQALDSQRMYTPNQDISYYTVADSHLSRMPLSYRRVEDMDPSMSFIKLMMIDEPRCWMPPSRACPAN
jgi:hypothetical protein